MTLPIILGICAVFFTLLVLSTHYAVILYNYLKTKSKKQKEDDVKKMRAILEEIRKEDETKTLNALNTLNK